MRILRASEYRRVPWRNGGGETREILVHPGGAGKDFDWRVSMAQVVTAGPFSVFPGVDRVLTVIEGGGLGLSLGGAPPVAVGEMPFAFPGDVACEAVLGAGPIVDLNVMTRRGGWRAEVSWAEGRRIGEGRGHRLAFAVDGRLSGRLGALAFDLGRRDTLHLEGAECAALDLPGRWLDIRLFPLDQGSPT